ncbi:PREDICTED: probable carboxylesterase 8 [Camelina sativa]|uniref:Probable carboxylesterase 8 n=1 Tax=Camelina sativa TaxID=90675 RepID=A0ABM0YVN5_CAMSA|nr:PREDICTED: probable carboxylesterase 8 [Camelina sativa]
MEAPPPSSDPYKFLNITLNSDGSLTRHREFPKLPPTEQSKDIPLNQTNNTFIRIFKPRNIPPESKLPIIVYYHGGGFLFYSAASAPFHESCTKMADRLQTIILSVEYRLSPEHRLPAAYEDAVEAVLWLRDQARGATNGGDCDTWLKDGVDFSKCFVMGSSSGGNIVYNVALRVVDTDLSPVKIQGLIMNQAFFGGVEPSDSESRLIDDKICPLPATHLLWSLCLPDGVDRDHVYSNPVKSSGPQEKDKMGRFPSTLINGYGGDPLVDRQRHVADMLKARGVHVQTRFDEDGYHACELFDGNKAKALYETVEAFIKSCCSSTGPSSNM